MHTTRQTGVETPYGAHNVYTFEVIRTVLFKDRGPLYSVFIRPRGAVDVARVGVPGGRRIRMIIGNLAIAYDDVMRQHAAHRFMESATNCFIGYFEFSPGVGSSGMQFGNGLFGKIERAGGRIGLEISTGAVTRDGV